MFNRQACASSIRVGVLACVKSKVLLAERAAIACGLRTASAGGAHEDTDFLDRKEGSGAGTAADADLGLVSESLSARLMVSLNGTRGPVAVMESLLHMDCSLYLTPLTADPQSRWHVQMNCSEWIRLKSIARRSANRPILHIQVWPQPTTKHTLKVALITYG